MTISHINMCHLFFYSNKNCYHRRATKIAILDIPLCALNLNTKKKSKKLLKVMANRKQIKKKLRRKNLKLYIKRCTALFTIISFIC